MVDRDETGLQHTQLKVRGNGLLDTREVVLADIRDATAILELFETRRPDVVFHAAALKHLPMLEQYPLEAWKTNVLGSRNVLEADKRVGVSTFVNISTDKANRRHLPRRYSHRRHRKAVPAKSGCEFLCADSQRTIGTTGRLPRGSIANGGLRVDLAAGCSHSRACRG